MNNVKDMSLKKATIINAVSKYSTVILNLFFSAILARILTPEDYGIVAVVTVFTTFFALFTNLGIGSAVIQNISLTEDDENKIFTFTIYLGVACAVAFSFFSVVLVKLYSNEVYYLIGTILSLSLLFSTLNMVPNAKLMKKKKFMQVGIRTIVMCVLSFCVALIIALLDGKYYALVAQSVISAFGIFVWNMFSCKMKISHKGMFKSMKKISGFTIYQSAFTFVNYFSRNLDNLLTGIFFGETELGYYDKSYKLMRYPVDNFTNVITPALLPMLSEYQNDIPYVLKQYNKIARMLATVAVYISLVCFFASNEIILLYFGDQWEPAVDSFHWLSLSLFFQIVGGISGSIYQIVNKTKEMFWSGVIGSLITVVFIVIGVYFGNIETLSICYVIGFVINFVKSQYFLAKFCFNESFKNLTKIYIPHLIIFVTIFIIMCFVPTLDSLLLSLLLKTFICTIVYVVMILVTKEYKSLILIFPQKLKNKFSKLKISR